MANQGAVMQDMEDEAKDLQQIKYDQFRVLAHRLFQLGEILSYKKEKKNNRDLRQSE